MIALIRGESNMRMCAIIEGRQRRRRRRQRRRRRRRRTTAFARSRREGSFSLCPAISPTTYRSNTRVINIIMIIHSCEHSCVDRWTPESCLTARQLLSKREMRGRESARESAKDRRGIVYLRRIISGSPSDGDYISFRLKGIPRRERERERSGVCKATSTAM